MINSSQVSYFTLAAYFDTGYFKYFYFLIVMLLYIIIIFANVLLIVIICMNRSLHEPMYLFLCSLFVNELYGSTGLFPSLLLHILSDIHTVSAFFCFMQSFCLYSYTSVEYLNLAIMSYDRYLAICFPLQYNTMMTYNKVAMLLAVVWLPPLLVNCIALLSTAQLQLCGNIINKVYCHNSSIVKLACSGSFAINLRGLLLSLAFVSGPFILILYTYMRILKVCFSGSTQTRQKAVSTCTPHLASIVNFSFGAASELLQSRFNMNNLPHVLRIFLSLYFLAFQPFFNPLIYGLNLSKIRVTCKSLILNIQLPFNRSAGFL